MFVSSSVFLSCFDERSDYCTDRHQTLSADITFHAPLHMGLR